MALQDVGEQFVGETLVSQDMMYAMMAIAATLSTAT